MAAREYSSECDEDHIKLNVKSKNKNSEILWNKIIEILVF